MTRATIRVRPFRKSFVTASGGTPTEISGELNGANFVVDVLGRHVPLDTVEAGVDESGPYAVVREGEHEVAGVIQVRVEPEYEPYGQTGGSITVYARGRRESALEQVRASGIDPDSVNLLVAVARSISVFFDPEGNINGEGSVG